MTRSLLALVLLTVSACSEGGDPLPTADAGQPDIPGWACPGGCGSDKCCPVGSEYFCITVSSDKANCGDCGEVCPPTKSNRCEGGACKCGYNNECGSTQTCCVGTTTKCADLQSDPANCGACGRSCNVPAETCVAGNCVCSGESPAVACTGTETCCSTGCVNVNTDPNNCGGCGLPCTTAPATSCNNGTCGCPGGSGAASCPSAGAGVVPLCCGPDCIDMCSDTSNCGGCGKACLLPLCTMGVCILDSLVNPDAGVPLSECTGM